MRLDGLKWCTACKARHEVSAFGLDATRGDGLRTVCRRSRHVEPRSISERFAAKVKRSDTGCLLWTGSMFPAGYGSFWFQGRVEGAHRVAWVLAHGPIPHGLYVLHRCDVRPCVEVSHLFLGDHAANMADMDEKGRRADVSGARNPRAKLTPEQVEQIRALSASGAGQRELGRRFGVTHRVIRRIANGQAWRTTAVAR